MYFADAGTQFLSDQIDAYVVAASSEVPCPSCLTGLMQLVGERELFDRSDGPFDQYQCQGCHRLVLIGQRT